MLTQEQRVAIQAARDLIADPDRWTQNANAADNCGIDYEVNDDRASCFCANGALGRACKVDPKRDGSDWSRNILYTVCFFIVCAKADELFGDGLISVNDDDDPVTAHANVLRIFDAVLA